MKIDTGVGDLHPAAKIVVTMVLGTILWLSFSAIAAAPILIVQIVFGPLAWIPQIGWRTSSQLGLLAGAIMLFIMVVRSWLDRKP